MTPGAANPASRSVAALLATAVLGCLAGLSPVNAQTVTATQDLSCLGTRAGSSLGCTANDFTTQATLTASDGTPSFCQAGQSFTFSAKVDLIKSGGSSRYDIGFFAGQNGNDPAVTGGMCSVATFPFSPLPFSNLEPGVPGDTCGDWSSSGTLAPTVQNLKVNCAGPTATDSNLSVPYVVSWYQNSSLTCSGPIDVKTDAGSKCARNTATILTQAGNLIQVGGYVDVTKQTLPDTDPQSFSYTATGPSGSVVGYQPVAGGATSGTVTSNNTNSVTFQLTDGQSVRVFMSVVAANRTLTITEQPSGQVAHWQDAASISCAAVTGAPTLTASNPDRRVTAVLNTTDSAGACTFTNTRRARIALVKQVAGRLATADQFQVTVSGAGASTLTDAANAAVAASAVAVTTSGSGTGAFANATNPTFRATPGQVLVLSDAMAAGSASVLADYDTRLSCSNAFAGPGATTGLPSGALLASYDLVPAAGDDITCTYTNTPKAKLTLAKVVVNDDGQSATATDWTLSATGPATIDGASGSSAVTAVTVPPGTYTLAESGPLGYAQTSLACTGTADADPADGLALASGETATCTFTNDDQPVGQTIDKTGGLSIDADGSGTVTVGDTLAYTVTVTNIGLVALTNLQVSDPQATPSSTTCANVAPGASCVLDATHVVTAGDEMAGEVANTASVVSDQIPGPETSNTVVVPVLPPPPAALAVTKSHTGTFPAGSSGSYTLQVANTGGAAVTGTTTVEDTLAPGLAFVSGVGSGWSCGAAGQVVTCTSSATVAAYGSMAPITLTVAIDAGMGTSVDNVASVANPSINGGTPVAGNTDTATIVHPDLSTSTKTVANLGGGATADVDAGDVLEYTITLVETAGAEATGVVVTDAVQAGLVGVTVSSMPAGATDHTSGSLVDVRNVTVPANGSVQVRFRVTVGGGFLPDDAIDNVATIDNPAGPGANPAAPTLVYAQSQVVVTGNKLLYLRDDGTGPASQVMDRDRPPTASTAGMTLTSKGASIAWTQSPVIPPGETLELDAGTVVASIPINTFAEELQLQVFLYEGGTSGTLIGQSSMRPVETMGAVSQVNFAITLNGNYAPLQPGDFLSLAIVNSTNGVGKDATIYAFNAGAAVLSFSTSTVVRVDSVSIHDEPYASGNGTAPYYLLGDTAYVRAVASDPFGGTDVGSASVVVTDAGGGTVAGPTAMTPVATGAADRTFEYAVAIPDQAALGTWTAAVTAYEGEEATVSHTAVSNFDVRGRVTLDQAWGSGAVAGDTLQLQVTGGVDAVDGSSIASDPATPATAVATASSTITLAQAFTSGNPGGYTISLACVRDADGVAVPVTGSGQSRQVQMPLDSSVTCTWTNRGTVALTLVKVAVVHSDPLNGSTNPKAIPGALVEYQVIVTNPGSELDGDSVVVTDSVPARVEFGIADINGSGSGSGPVRFTDGTPPSGLAYAYPADIAFSADNGSTWNYVPSDPDGDGVDPAITDIRVNPKGSFAGGGAQFTLSFRVRVR